MTRVSQTLFSYLVLQRQRLHSRDVLVNLLWGDMPEARARNCFNTALWRLRNVLEPDGVQRGAYLVTTPAGEIGFNNESDYWLDVAVLEMRANTALAKPIALLQKTEVHELEAALRLYQGDLMEGFYDDWALGERERLRDLYLRSLAHLMKYYQEDRLQGERSLEKSLAYGQQILRYDPLREEIHRELMRIYVANGERARAIRQYETCCQILETELGIPPMEETQHLLAQIAPELADQHSSVRPVEHPVTVDLALQQLRLALGHFEEAQIRLFRATELMEQISRTQ